MSKPEPISDQEYKEKFHLEGKPFSSQNSREGVEKALEQALKNREFEISLYWTRATYFWALIGASIAGYVLLQVKGNSPAFFVSLIVSGLVSTLTMIDPPVLI